MLTNTQSDSSFVPKPLSILVADDTPEARTTLALWLQELGHRVTAVTCGNEAIRRLECTPFDLVFTEVIMPNGDGLEVILAVRRLHPGTPIVAMSGGGRYLPVAECLHVAKGLGATAVLPKPAQKSEVFAALDRALAAVANAVA